MAEWTKIAEALTGSDVGVERISTHVMMKKPKFFVGYPVGEP